MSSGLGRRASTMATKEPFPCPSSNRSIPAKILQRAYFAFCLLSCSALRPRAFDFHCYVPPFPLSEPHDAEGGAGEMAEDDGEPDVAGGERPDHLDQGAHADGDRDLRGQGDIERAACVAGALQAAGVDERDGDEEA